jgi:plasmid stabilization system protein ParE
MVRTSSYAVVWDENALTEFSEILDHLAKQSERAPSIVKSSVLKRISEVRRNPLICEIDRLKFPSDEMFRAFVVFSYRVTYKINSETRELWILRIRHTSREPLNY